MAPLEHSAEDAAIVEAQLGRPPRSEWSVARRCHLGVPMVIESAPVLADGSPFPTLFWLTCPVLVKRIGTLEATGVMAELNERLVAEPELRQRLIDALGRYRERRDSLGQIEDSGAPPGGGPDRLKCLHAHSAHELGDPPNPVGARALAAAGWPDCVAPCVSVK